MSIFNISNYEKNISNLSIFNINSLNINLNFNINSLNISSLNSNNFSITIPSITFYNFSICVRNNCDINIFPSIKLLNIYIQLF